MKKSLKIQGQFSFQNESFSIRPVNRDDIETLRVWKNQNRQYFAHQKIITATQQERWFEQFQENDHQSLLVCENKDRGLVACVGFRFNQTEKLNQPPSEKRIELFNLLCGDPELLGVGFVSTFYSEVERRLVEKTFDLIYLCVLKDNDRAIRWYERHGYENYGKDDISYFMKRPLGRISA